jgi:CO/xanthine dehydrogenase Mo-binding subunit
MNTPMNTPMNKMSGASEKITMQKQAEQSAIEPERFEFQAKPVHSFELARRDFFKVLGAGIAVFAVARNAQAQETAPGHPMHMPELPKEISAWLHVGENGKVTALVGKAEVGQNIRTSLAQTVADELHVRYEDVAMTMADTAITPFDMGTFGSRTTPTMTPQLRRVASAARDMLLETAAKQWNIAPDGLIAANGQIKDPKSGRTLSYGELAKGKALERDLPAADPVTPPQQWTIAGTPVPKANALEFVTGAHKYTADMRLPGMLYGKVLRAPAFGASMASCNHSAAKAIAGVVVVRDGDFVGVAAPSERQAEAALNGIHAQWKETPQLSDRDLFSHIKEAGAGKTDERFEKQQKGSVNDGLANAAHKLEATYTVAFIAHAPLEPRAAVAEWKDGKLTVWTGTQRPFAVRADCAVAFHVSETDVRVIVPDTGSAYGGKHTSDAALEAARLARGAGKPVKVVWTREEEFTWAYFRPAGLIEVKAGVSSDGKLTAWQHETYHCGTSGIESPYEAPNERIAFHPVPVILRSGSYRGLAATANHFARETHMDALAHAAAVDPLEFRLKNTQDARLRAVLQAAAKGFGWPPRKAQPGQGFGIAAGNEKGGYVATCAEVAVDKSSGEVRVVRMAEAFECGAIVNPDGLRNQVVGAMIQGLGGALFESVGFENGRIRNPHFATYRVPRFRDVPQIEAVLLDRRDLDPAGAGETPIMAVAPAVGNAIFDATGIRLQSLPLAPNGVRGNGYGASA